MRRGREGGGGVDTYLVGPLDVELNLLAGERADPGWLGWVVSVCCSGDMEGLAWHDMAGWRGCFAYLMSILAVLASHGNNQGMFGFGGIWRLRMRFGRVAVWA
jgi:hypothetical protein